MKSRDRQIFDLIQNGEIHYLVCIKEGYLDPEKGDSFRKGGEKHTLNKKYKLTVKKSSQPVFLETNFGYSVNIICGSGVSIWFETEQQYNILKRKEKLDKITNV